MMGKLNALLKKMEAKVDAELADPKRKDDPTVAVDVKMLQTMKDAVKKSEALVLVAALAMKKAKTDKERKKIKAEVSFAMHKVMGKLKEDVQALKAEAMVLASAQTAVAAHNAKKDHAPPPDADTDADQTSAKSDADDGSASTYPEDKDKWVFEHPKEQHKSHKVDEDTAAKEDEPKDGDAEDT